MATAFSRALVFEETTNGEYALIGFNPNSMSFRDLEISLKIMIVPEKYKNKPVTSISHRAFKNCEFVYKVFLPKSINFIGDEAFANCENLQEFFCAGDYRNSLTMGHLVFRNCEKLEHVEIKSLLITGTKDFCGCKNLHDFNCYYIDCVPTDFFNECKRLSYVEFVKCERLNRSSFAGTSVKEINIHKAIPTLCDGTVEHWIKEGVKITCSQDNPLANLAYEGLNVEII